MLNEVLEEKNRRGLDRRRVVRRGVKTGISAIDKMGIMEITWYTGQLQRIGRGRLPKPNELALWVFLKFAFKQARAGRKNKTPTKLRAS